MIETLGALTDANNVIDARPRAGCPHSFVLTQTRCRAYGIMHRFNRLREIPTGDSTADDIDDPVLPEQGKTSYLSFAGM